jgi:hypothetical protein
MIVNRTIAAWSAPLLGVHAIVASGKEAHLAASALLFAVPYLSLHLGPSASKSALTSNASSRSSSPSWYKGWRGRWSSPYPP